MATAAARITPQMIASKAINSTGCPSAVAIQPLPSNDSVSVTTARASGHSRHHGSRDWASSWFTINAPADDAFHKNPNCRVSGAKANVEVNTSRPATLPNLNTP
ncbi:MAG TPA: hypothetical protein VII41_12215, partial [Steroidobacteraceae bacterium]